MARGSTGPRVDRLNLIASWTREEGAPSIAQLGDPIIETGDTPRFRLHHRPDGQCHRHDRRQSRRSPPTAARCSSSAANYKPWAETDFRLRADFVQPDDRRPDLQLPRPERRAGSCVRRSLHPRRRRQSGQRRLPAGQLRSVAAPGAALGIRFHQAAQVGAAVARADPAVARALPAAGRRRAGRTRPPHRPACATSPKAAHSARGTDPARRRARRSDGGRGLAGGGGGRGFGGGGFGGGGANRGRLQLSMTHTVTFVDEADDPRRACPSSIIWMATPAASRAARPRHRVELQAGWSNNGLGARLSGNWRSGTRVEGGRQRRSANFPTWRRSICACSPISASGSTWSPSIRG